MLTTEQLARNERDGYLVIRGLFAPHEVERLREHFMGLRARGGHPGDMVAQTAQSGDPLLKFPRMIHMHRWDELSLGWLLDGRLNACLTDLLGGEPFAVQTMLYFKPAGARGQALHQDNFYLRAHPGTCMAAWLALDPCDEENGCMRVVPGSHQWPLLCTQAADTQASFTDVTVPVPEGQEVRPVLMEPGDVLFFNGSLIHGSFPNTTADRFRRALIGHYIEGRAERVTKFDQPVLRMDGTAVELEDGLGGGPCGVWREIDGRPEVEMTAGGAPATAGHE